MSMSRSEIRENVFKLLFRAEFNTQEEMPEQTEYYFDVDTDGEISKEDRDIISKREEAVLSKLSDIDAAISEKTVNWTIDRFGKVDLAIIRLAVFEILFDEDVPTGVAINEAVELAKKYGRDESKSFVNGVLAKFAK